MRRSCQLLVAACGLVLASDAMALDPMLDGDPRDPASGEVIVVLPGAPWLRPGADALFGTPDDQLRTDIVGDVDLVVRAGAMSVGAVIPPPSPLRGEVPRGVAEPFGRGTPIDFVVIASDGSAAGGGAGAPVVPPYWEGLPLLVTAFGDLDGDGFVGITQLDGNADDVVHEMAELTPLGVGYAIARGGRAEGQIAIFAGGPRTAPLRIALTATAYAGHLDETYLSGLVPNGPAVSTRLPFLPEFDPLETLQLGVFGLLPAMEEGRVAFQLQVAGFPDPSDPRWGEAYTLRLDGSDPSIGIAEVESGSFAGFGVAMEPSSSVGLRLRPGAPMGHGEVAVETPSCVHVADDGEASTREITIVPLDTLGNVTMPPAPTWVQLRTRGHVRISSPDLDGDPEREEVLVSDASGARVVLDDFGGRFDDFDLDRLLLDGAGREAGIELLMTDPDVDDDGAVSANDGYVIAACQGLAHGDAGFDPRLDLDGSGSIDPADHAIVEEHLGLYVARDWSDRNEKKGKNRKWKQSKLRRPHEAREVKALEERDKRKKKERERAKKEREKKEKERREKGEPDPKKLRKEYCRQSS